MSRSLLTNSVVFLLIWVSLLVACAPKGIYHTVQPGQTLYRIAKTYEIDESRLALINDIKDPTQLKANQRLYIPGVTQPRKVPVTAKTSSTSSRVTSVAPTTKKKPTATISKPATKKPAQRHLARPPNQPKGFFTWPVKGQC